MTHLQQATDNLKTVTNNEGIFKVMNIYQVLNQLQKAEDPMAYKPEVEIMIERKKEREKKENEERKRVEDNQQKKKDEQFQHEKALFDFDEEINYLDQVEERYAVQTYAKSTTTEDDNERANKGGEMSEEIHTEVLQKRKPIGTVTKLN